jgi:hypothetical protein
VAKKKKAKRRKSRVKTGVEPVGLDSTKEAQAVHDSTFMTPEENLADDAEIASRALKQVSDFIASEQMGRVELNDRMWVQYNLWDGSPISRFVPNARSVHVPEPRKAVESAHVRLSEILIGPQHWFRVVGDDVAGVKNADNIKQLIEYELRVDGFRDKFDQVARGTCIYGWAPSKLRWKVDRRTIKYNKVTKKPNMKGSAQVSNTVTSKPEEMEIDLSRPTLDIVDVYDFGTDLRFRDHQESPGCYTAVELSEQEVLGLRDAGWLKNVQQMVDREPTGTNAAKGTVGARGPIGTFSNPALYKDLRNQSTGISTLSRNEEVSRRYKIYEYYGKFDPKYDPASKETGEEAEYMIVLGRRIIGRQEESSDPGYTVLCIRKNPWWHGRRPVLVSHYIRRPHCFQSVGIVEPMVRLCLELDDTRNMALQARALASKPIIVSGPTAEIYGENVILDPGSHYKAENPRSDIAFPFIPDLSDVAYKAEAVIKGDIREVAGVAGVLEGVGPERGETATSIVNRIRQSNKRIAGPARTMSDTFLVPMLEMMHSMNQQCMTEERIIQILGEDGLSTDIKKITPADIVGRVHFEVVTYAEIELAGVEGSMMMNFLNAAAPYAQNIQGLMDESALLRVIFEKQFGSRYIDEIFPNSAIPKKMLTSNQEHLLISHGHPVIDPQPGESIRAHLNSHLDMIATKEFKDWPEDYQRTLLAHTENTKMELGRLVEQVIPALPPGVGQGAGMDMPVTQRTTARGRPSRPVPPQGTVAETRSMGARVSPPTPGVRGAR